MAGKLENFLNENGQVIQWPSKHSNKQLVLEYLNSKFEMTRAYSEKEVNELLRSWHTFDDWAILRRSLVDYNYMTRKIDSSEYRRLR